MVVKWRNWKNKAYDDREVYLDQVLETHGYTATPSFMINTMPDWENRRNYKVLYDKTIQLKTDNGRATHRRWRKTFNFKRNMSFGRIQTNIDDTTNIFDWNVFLYMFTDAQMATGGYAGAALLNIMTRMTYQDA